MKAEIKKLYKEYQGYFETYGEYDFERLEKIWKLKGDKENLKLMEEAFNGNYKSMNELNEIAYDEAYDWERE